MFIGALGVKVWDRLTNADTELFSLEGTVKPVLLFIVGVRGFPRELIELEAALGDKNTHSVLVCASTKGDFWTKLATTSSERSCSLTFLGLFELLPCKLRPGLDLLCEPDWLTGNASTPSLFPFSRVVLNGVDCLEPC